MPRVCNISATLIYASFAPQAEPQFLAAAGQHFCIEAVPSEELDEVFQCADVDVLLLTLKQRKDETQGERLGRRTARGCCGGSSAQRARRRAHALTALLFQRRSHSLQPVPAVPRRPPSSRPAAERADR